MIGVSQKEWTMNPPKLPDINSPVYFLDMDQWLEGSSHILGSQFSGVWDLGSTRNL